ncbi:hypothetical protein RJ639_036656 [Escallonia herrerae]|uniref:CN hydrolase domain-containing protein n=1 Tax=Escallonia herrerae TaxID=1293975 RepID=A0AA88WNX7_9ASTE|nr:hypothetical protein RJ639_036656 [Escallonia herrerae]
MASLTSSTSCHSLTMPKVAQFKIGLCQLSVTPDKTTNLSRARNSIEIAAKQGASLVVLPEMWNCPYSEDYFAKLAEDFNDEDGSPSYFMLSEVASCLGITIVGGSMPELKDGRLYNTCCVFGPDGKLKAKHRKLHMFDANIPGDILYKESDTFTAGDNPTIVETDMGRIGIGICHDIRFPELAMLYRTRGANLICYPGAFNMSTGKMLWELEQRARQLYVASCSPSRDSVGSYTIWGHSTLVGPFGEVIATSGHEETIVIAEIDYSALQCRREGLPLENQRRGDIYQFVDIEEQRP